MRQIFSILIIMIGVGSQGFMALGQSFEKNPRVLELEAKFTADAYNYVQARFPNIPILISVSIDPLRRTTALDNPQESLPYSIQVDNEIIDEWDDPKRTIYELIPRIRSAYVRVVLPQTISDRLVLETREALFASLGLIPARDRIEFERRDWVAEEPSETYWNEISAVAAMIFFLALFGILGMRHAAMLVSRGLQKSGHSGSTIVNAAPSLPALQNYGPTPKGQNFGGGDVRFNDPIKLRVQLKLVIETLCKDQNFPTLDDMVALNTKAKENPALFGALISEFPQEMRENLFVHSFDKSWLEAFVAPGELTIEAYEFISRMAKVDRIHVAEYWRDMLLAVWRLDDLMPEFLRSLGHERGLGVLFHLPTSISIPMGKQAFPGSWGSLLSTGQKPKPLSKDVADKIKVAAIGLRPLQDLSMLEDYRHERGLLEFIRTANVKDEQEIYEASKKDAVIHRLRPPFFPIFKASKDEIEKLLPQFSIEDWALALLNVDRHDRKSIEAAMSEKQRFMLIETLKRLDKNPPPLSAVGQIRETIGNQYHFTLETLHLRKDMTAEASMPSGPDVGDGESDVNAAA